MKQFTITYVYQVLFGQGFRKDIEQVYGAKAALRVLKRIRNSKKFPALMVWIVCK